MCTLVAQGEVEAFHHDSTLVLDYFVNTKDLEGTGEDCILIP